MNFIRYFIKAASRPRQLNADLTTLDVGLCSNLIVFSKLIPNSSLVCVWNPSLVYALIIDFTFSKYSNAPNTANTELQCSDRMSRRTNKMSSNRVQTENEFLLCTAPRAKATEGTHPPTSVRSRCPYQDQRIRLTPLVV